MLSTSSCRFHNAFVCAFLYGWKHWKVSEWCCVRCMLNSIDIDIYASLSLFERRRKIHRIVSVGFSWTSYILYYAKLHFYVHNPITLWPFSRTICFMHCFREYLSFVFFSFISVVFFVNLNNFHFFFFERNVYIENWLFRKSRMPCTKLTVANIHTHALKDEKKNCE